MSTVPLPVYSFLDYNCELNGPGGSVSLGSYAGDAEEGVSIEAVEDANLPKFGADGTPMHSLNPVTASKITVRLLKTSPTNALLMQMFNYQRSSALYWAQNIMSMRHNVTGDSITATGVAFQRVPPLTYAKEAGTIEWEFIAGYCDTILGEGITV